MTNELKTINIKGKEYVEVNERIMHFRESKNYAGFSLISEIVSLNDGICVIKASILNADGVVVAVGHAYENENSGFINKTSYIENCETSAWGRALGNLGIGITSSVASAEEVLNAQKQQAEKKEHKPKVETSSNESFKCRDCGKDITEKVYNFKSSRGAGFCYECQKKN